MNFRQVNRFLQQFNCSTNSIRSIGTDSMQNRLFVSYLGMNHRDAELYIHKFKLDHLEPTRLESTIKFLLSQNYRKYEILKTPKLFQMCAKCTWEQYYLLLKECGFSNVTVKDLINFRKLKFYSIKALKKHEYIPSNIIVAKQLLTHLNPATENLKVDDLLDENLLLTYIHTSFVNRYLMYRLFASIQDIEKIARIHHQIYNKSIRYLCDNINFARELGFSKEKILNNAYLLHTHPSYTKEVLEKIPHIAGSDLKQQMRSHPKLIGIPLMTFNTIYDMLKEEHITDDAIRKCMPIFTLSPKTIRSRLDSLKNTPETRVLMSNPGVLNLILHYYRSKNRLSFLGQAKLKCSSLSVITYNSQHFEDYLKEGKDITKSAELVRFIKNLLNSQGKLVEKNIRRHPFFLYVPFVSIEKTYNYLRTKHFNNKQIVSAVQILLYPQDKIQMVLEKIKKSPQVNSHQKRVTKSQVLNLALYHLEKAHHFTGNGIWTNVENEELQ